MLTGRNRLAGALLATLVVGAPAACGADRGGEAPGGGASPAATSPAGPASRPAASAPGSGSASAAASAAPLRPDDPTPPVVRRQPMNEAGLDVLRAEAMPLDGEGEALDALVDSIRDAEIVMIGEASHGTHEFLRTRAEITERLVLEAGFDGVVIEGDWPSAARVDRFVRGEDDDAGPPEALGDFRRFPSWMWRNEEVAAFVDWLRRHNASVPAEARAGFYGMDIYSLDRSIDEVVALLEPLDPDAAARARERYACLRAHDTPEAYGMAAGRDEARSCAAGAGEQVADIERMTLAATGGSAEATLFAAARNAAVVRSAEAFLRATYGGGDEPAWNIRDRHMFETVQALRDRLGGEREPARLVVWAHNTHVGDARGTAMADRGELNVGQLVRQAEPATAVSIGFTTYDGSVVAARRWGGEGEERAVKPALNESWEALFHRVTEGDAPDDLLLDLRPGEPLREALDDPRLERAIGVIYRPETERVSHYFTASLPVQFDVVIHLDRTSALRPLEPLPGTAPPG